jgi:hypothetical protein
LLSFCVFCDWTCDLFDGFVHWFTRIFENELFIWSTLVVSYGGCCRSSVSFMQQSLHFVLKLSQWWLNCLDVFESLLFPLLIEPFDFLFMFSFHFMLFFETFVWRLSDRQSGLSKLGNVLNLFLELSHEIFVFQFLFI